MTTIHDDIAAARAALQQERREEQTVRPWLTAKAYRALGYPIPARIPDDAVVELVVEGET